jgi:hypothetical protein
VAQTAGNAVLEFGQEIPAMRVLANYLLAENL